MELTSLVIWLCVLMLSHWLGDFVLQTDWMAQHKSSRWDALSIHVFVYTIVVTIIGVIMPTMFMVESKWSLLIFFIIYPRIIGFFLATYVLHFVTDAITSRITSHYYKMKENHKFFVVIGFDQFIHFVCLAFSLAMLVLKEV